MKRQEISIVQLRQKMKEILVLLIFIQFSFAIVAKKRYPVLSKTVPLLELTDPAVKADIFNVSSI